MNQSKLLLLKCIAEQSGVKPVEVNSKLLKSIRYYFSDKSGFWCCNHFKDGVVVDLYVTLFGKKNSLMYILMNEMGYPLKTQGCDILQVELKDYL